MDLLSHTGKKRLGWASALSVLLGILALYGWFDPAHVAFFPPCPFKFLTGLECPGCGSQRCMHQLLHGHVRQAFGYNPLLVLSLPYLLLGGLLEYSPLGRMQTNLHRRLYGKTAALSVVGLVVLYWIGRNVF